MKRRTFVASAVAVGTFAAAGCSETGERDGPTVDTTAGKQGSTEASATTAETTAGASTIDATATPTYAAEPVVTVAEYAFTPRRLRVRPGTEVTWTNEGDDSHTVQSEVFNPEVATDWSFYSADLVSGNSVGHVFEESGVYEYYCTAHGQARMCGVVLVGDVEYAATLPCEG